MNMQVCWEVNYAEFVLFVCKHHLVEYSSKCHDYTRAPQSIIN